MNLNSKPVRIPVLTNRRSRGQVAKLPCLCNCGRLTGGRFAPGHDGKIQSLVLDYESGIKVPAPHTKVVAIEAALRKAAGLTGQAHVPIQLTREDVA